MTQGRCGSLLHIRMTLSFTTPRRFNRRTRRTEMEYSTQELRERKALTDAIAANLRTINDDGNDLEEMARQVRDIVGGLKVINEDEKNLDELELTTVKIRGNLRGIN